MSCGENDRELKCPADSNVSGTESQWVWKWCRMFIQEQLGVIITELKTN